MMDQGTEYLSKCFSKIPLFIYAPNLLKETTPLKAKELFPKFVGLNMFDSTVHASNPKFKERKLWWWCSGTTILYIGEPMEKKLELSEVDTGTTIVHKQTLEATKKYLTSHSQNYNNRFRIVVSLQETSEILQTIRTTFGLRCPVLFFSNDNPLKAEDYQHSRISHTSDRAEVRRFCELIPLEWALDLSDGVAGSKSSFTWEGMMCVMAIKGTNLASKDPNGFSDPYIKFSLGNTKYNLKKQLKTLNPSWDDFEWNIPCNHQDVAKFEIWDWDQFTTDDYMGEVKFNLFSLLNEIPKDFDGKFFTKTFTVQKKKNYSGAVSGTLAITMGYKIDSKLAKYHFGKPLSESVEYSFKKHMKHLTYSLLGQLMKSGTFCEGIIRIPGNKGAIHRLKEQIDSGAAVDILLENEDPFDIAGVLKLYFSELPDSLITEKAFKLLSLNPFTPESLPEFNAIFQENVPSDNKDIFSALCKYFEALVNNTEVTMMTPPNLGISIGPTLLLSPAQRDDPVAFLENSRITANMLAFVITNAETIFNWKSN
eukprot:TRINITY_DN1538_c0_g2_i2.p1 TRINITY_DN1538_c0_g2~~TRINITY_DN1538_c0_g2_i2.p1  ORF type:complete len:600 (-),score=126.16 TRINITY_DN1538_c0_g2_i2:33-1646(-)